MTELIVFKVDYFSAFRGSHDFPDAFQVSRNSVFLVSFSLAADFFDRNIVVPMIYIVRYDFGQLMFSSPRPNR